MVREYPDCKLHMREMQPGEVVQSHRHAKGHITVVIGSVLMRLPDREEVVTNGHFYVPADLEHSILARTSAKTFCVGAKDF